MPQLTASTAIATYYESIHISATAANPLGRAEQHKFTSDFSG